MDADVSAHYGHHKENLFARPSTFPKEDALRDTQPYVSPRPAPKFDPKSMVKLITWNVNGIRAVLRKSNDLQTLIAKEKPDVLCLQETKLAIARDAAEIGRLPGYAHVDSISVWRNGYSGTRVYLRTGSAAAEGLRVAYCPKAVAASQGAVKKLFPLSGIVEGHAGTKGAPDDDNPGAWWKRDGIEKPEAYEPQLPHDNEGRMVCVELPDMLLVNTYVPNSGVPMVDKLDRRVKEWDITMRRAIASLRKYAALSGGGKPVVWVGDFNVADRDWDRHWEGSYGSMTEQAGFTPKERTSFRTTLREGRLVDAFRWLHPTARDVYTYWSAYHRGREGNRGWRIDGFCVTAEHRERIVHCYPMPVTTFQSSDHNPVILWMKKHTGKVAKRVR